VAAKTTLNSITTGYLDVDLLNDNIEQIATAIDNTLSRDGTSPNQMEANIDMNSYRLTNLPPAASNTEPMTYGQAIGLSNGWVVQKKEVQVGGGAVFTLTTLFYQPGTNNLAVYVNGVRQFVGLDFTETSSTVVTFLAATPGASEVVFLTNDFVATLDAPEPTSVAWAILTGVPAFASRWPTYAEVTSKPTTFIPEAHLHAAADITTGRLLDERRGVYVQATQPTANTVGELWFY